jgi:Rieske Fe-S protein
VTRELTRRSFTKAAFFGSLAIAGLAGGAALVNMLSPRNAAGDDIVVPRDRVPAPGDPPLYVADGNFLLVNLAPGEGYDVGIAGASPGGMLAISERCTHLACAVHWRTDRRLDGGFIDVIACECHSSFFTRAGLRISGPAPRSLDTLALRVTPGGDVVVEPSIVRLGDMSNPARAVPYPPAR